MAAHGFAYAVMGFIAFIALLIAYLVAGVLSFVALLLVVLGIGLVVLAALKMRGHRQGVVIGLGVVSAFVGVVLALLSSTGGSLGL